MKNYYLEEFRKLDNDYFYSYKKRQSAVKLYAWAIPDDTAIAKIAAFNDIIEIGAGTGYWAKLISEKGARIFPFDANPPKDGNPYGHQQEWTPILQGSFEVLHRFSPRFALFLCWPPYGASLAFDCLYHFKGNDLIYIGEDKYGCTADNDFFSTIYKEWELKDNYRLPQWVGIHDYLKIYRRKHAKRI